MSVFLSVFQTLGGGLGLSTVIQLGFRYPRNLERMQKADNERIHSIAQHSVQLNNGFACISRFCAAGV